MKYFLFHIITVLLFQTAASQTKHALLFAIGNYPSEGGWSAISSSRDAFYIRSTLLKQGFREENIKMVTDENATPQGISTALSGLIAEVHAGDIAVIHFSSHGEQIEDNNADETDGLDESIVTYHAVAPRLSKDFDRDQEAYFRDDEFGQYINQLRSRIGRSGDVAVFMDLCHSGTGTRGQAVVRGGQPPLVSAGFDPKRYAGRNDARLFEESTPGTDEKTWATYVVFSAARADELNYEIKDENNEGIGSLTYAISKVFENLDAGTTYRSLFAKIQSVMNRMAPGQHPVLEGNGIDRALLGGQFIQQKPYVEIETIKGVELTLKSGKLYGLDSGAKVAVYPSGTTDPARAAALATGIVTKAESYAARVKLDNDPGIRERASAWVFITEPVYRLKPVSISTGPGFSETDRMNIKESLKDIPLIRWEGEPELIIVKGRNGDSIKIASNGYTFKTLENAGSGTEELKKALQRYVQYKFLQGLEIKDPSIRVEVLLVPVVDGKPDTAKIDTKVVNGTYEFTEGDRFVLWVKNRGNSPVYINVLDMQPDGIINPVFPFKKKYIYPEDLKINRRSSRLFDMAKYIITVAPPYGTEIFKIFVSKKDIDMEGIAGRGDDDRSAVTISEDLVKRFFEVGTHKTENLNLSNTNGSTYSLLFEIRPKK